MMNEFTSFNANLIEEKLLNSEHDVKFSCERATADNANI